MELSEIKIGMSVYHRGIRESGFIVERKTRTNTLAGHPIIAVCLTNGQIISLDVSNLIKREEFLHETQ